MSHPDAAHATVEHPPEQLAPPTADTCRMVWIRHGETTWNAEKRFQGHLDIPLSPTGIEQAERLARRWAQWTLQQTTWRIEHLYSSDLSRALDTARHLSATIGLQPVIEPDLRERNYGVLSGLTATEMQLNNPALFMHLQARTPDAPVPEGESLRAFYDRVMRQARQLADTHRGQTIAVVAHGGVLDCIYRHARGIGLEPARQWLLLNTSINVVDASPEGWTIRCWGDVNHLDGSAHDEVDQRVA